MPPRLLVLGAGAVGMEFASIFSRFGSKVTVVELLDRVLPLEDADVSAEVAKAFRRQGIAVHVATRAEDVKVAEGVVRCKAVTAGGETLDLEADKLLLAVGRQANFKGIGLESTKVQIERGRIVVDEFCRTHEEGVYAIGDLLPTPWLAHVASMQGMLAAEHIAGKNPPPINYNQVPSCTYCWPEVGTIGLSEAQAREKGYDVRIGTFPFTASAKAAILGETAGFVKVVADAKYDEVLGLHIVGPTRHRADRRGRGGAARRAHRRGAHPHDPRPPDAARGDPRGGRGGARCDDSPSRPGAAPEVPAVPGCYPIAVCRSSLAVSFPLSLLTFDLNFLLSGGAHAGQRA